MKLDEIEQHLNAATETANKRIDVCVGWGVGGEGQGMKDEWGCSRIRLS